MVVDSRPWTTTTKRFQHGLAKCSNVHQKRNTGHYEKGTIGKGIGQACGQMYAQRQREQAENARLRREAELRRKAREAQRGSQTMSFLAQANARTAGKFDAKAGGSDRIKVKKRWDDDIPGGIVGKVLAAPYFYPKFRITQLLAKRAEKRQKALARQEVQAKREAAAREAAAQRLKQKLIEEERREKEEAERERKQLEEAQKAAMRKARELREQMEKAQKEKEEAEKAEKEAYSGRRTCGTSAKSRRRKRLNVMKPNDWKNLLKKTKKSMPSKWRKKLLLNRKLKKKKKRVCLLKNKQNRKLLKRKWKKQWRRKERKKKPIVQKLNWRRNGLKMPNVKRGRNGFRGVLRVLENLMQLQGLKIVKKNGSKGLPLELLSVVMLKGKADKKRVEKIEKKKK